VIRISAWETARGPINDVTKPTEKFVHSDIWFSDYCELVQHFIGNERAHLIPLTLL
jgi:hypothetical protein